MIFAIFVAAGGIIWRLAENKAAILDRLDEHKEQIDDELTAIRTAAFTEYQILRKEMVDSSAIARKEFGDTIHAIREKVVQVELWVRDEFKNTRHTFYGALDMRHQIVLEKIEKVEERSRQLELFQARHFGMKSDA